MPRQPDPTAADFDLRRLTYADPSIDLRRIVYGKPPLDEFGEPSLDPGDNCHALIPQEAPHEPEARQREQPRPSPGRSQWGFSNPAAAQGLSPGFGLGGLSLDDLAAMFSGAGFSPDEMQNLMQWLAAVGVRPLTCVIV
jgi:hypothetical protein